MRLPTFKNINSAAKLEAAYPLLVPYVVAMRSMLPSRPINSNPKGWRLGAVGVIIREDDVRGY